MADQAFLDKGVLLGYCFTVDVHHRKCAQYIESNLDCYITEDVKTVFERNSSRIVHEHRTEILNHVSQLKKSDFSGELGPMELKDIRTTLISKGRFPNSWRYLRDYYADKNLISVGELEIELREIARQIEAIALDRRDNFHEIIIMWSREEDYPQVQSNLKEIRQDDEEDFWVCIDAHDLSVRTNGSTELATTDPKDFVRNGRRELIISNTGLDDVQEVAITSRQ